MATFKKTALLGLFVSIGVVMFILGVLVISSQRKLFVPSVRASAVFDDIQGLQVGNNIWFSGVKVGTVKEINFQPGNKVEVVFNVDKDARSFIHNDARARIGTDGLIGNRIVVIFGGTDTAGSLADGTVLHSERTLQTADMLNTLAESNRNLLAVTDYVKRIAMKVDSGRGTIGTLLNDRQLALNLQHAVTMLRLASANAVQLTAGINEFAADLNRPGGLANNLANDTVVFAELRQSVWQIQQVTARAEAAVANIQRATEGLDNQASPVGMMLHDQASAGELKETISNLRAASVKLDEDLEALQHSFLLKGYFKHQKPAAPPAASSTAKQQ